MNWPLLVLAGCASFGGHPGKNQLIARHGRATDFKANVTRAAFDGKLVVLELGPRVRVTIASCYAHAQQKIGDHDHVVIQLDGQDARDGELDVADCTTKHVVASLWAEFADGTKLEASIDSDLTRP
ncbi:MAG: hypothetical protein ABI467_01605 [Kofleriaceae bacterium]